MMIRITRRRNMHKVRDKNQTLAEIVVFDKGCGGETTGITVTKRMRERGKKHAGMVKRNKGGEGGE